MIEQLAMVGGLMLASATFAEDQILAQVFAEIIGDVGKNDQILDTGKAVDSRGRSDPSGQFGCDTWQLGKYGFGHVVGINEPAVVEPPSQIRTPDRQLGRQIRVGGQQLAGLSTSGTTLQCRLYCRVGG
ncbi:hypothetical protein [Nocardia vaccinii]|uniref:hypothetical protein n=1 Tax=Nocardia vaccinii TaxID=1822 RepID=UPI0008365FAC|nr:hypothetical protein [Nocardia vaccinii]